MKLKNKHGQSVLEYLILVAAVIGLLIAFLAPGGFFQRTVNATYNGVVGGMSGIGGRLANEWKGNIIVH